MRSKTTLSGRDWSETGSTDATGNSTIADNHGKAALVALLAVLVVAFAPEVLVVFTISFGVLIFFTGFFVVVFLSVFAAVFAVIFAGVFELSLLETTLLIVA